MWDLPGPGLEPVSPALAGGFLTTAPPGKPVNQLYALIEKIDLKKGFLNEIKEKHIMDPEIRLHVRVVLLTKFK